MKFRREDKGQAPGFQVAPMIDVMFLLLCFFMASQIFSQWETEVDVQLPTATTGLPQDRMLGEVIVNVLHDGRYVVNRRELDDRELGRLFGRIVDLSPGQPVLIRADRGTAYEHIIRVLDLCRRADIYNISFATSFVKEPPSR
ncbi:MAG: biopolymer transporter ExbD [Lentisphaerae bacterium]|nr:biopolymer transporter ExbD [Lentisphaerota bacterium]